MKNTRKIICGLLVTLIIIFLPNVAKAEEDSYILYENIKADGNPQNGWSSDGINIELDMNNATNYSFDVKGINLEVDETYVLELLSDFMSFSKKYTGQELIDGINISRSDGDSKILSRVYLESNKQNLKGKISSNNQLYEKVYFKFNNNFDSTEMDAHFKKIAPNGKVKINAIKVNDYSFIESSISSSLSKYNTDKYWVIGYCQEDYKDCVLYINDTINHKSKKYDVEYIFSNTDNTIFTKVNKYLNNFKNTSGTIEQNMFRLDDLENINYKYTVIKTGREDLNTLNSIINYSSEIQSILEYGNLTAILDTRAGWGEEFTAGGFGYLNLLYNGTIYGVVDRVGVKQVNVLYVSDDTNDTRDAYISAALKRVKDYLPNASVSLTYAGDLDNLDMQNWIIPLEDLIDVDKTLGEYYTLTIDGNNYSFFIVKDSSKMKNPEMNTVDLKTNIKVNSDSYEVPLDAKINANILDKNSTEYKNIINKLNLNNGITVDLNLYSGLTDAYITKLNNGKFRVYVPITEEYLNKDLNAYYIKDDGSIEIHKVTVEDGYAVFETNHFSTYTIGTNDLINPNTFDNAITWFVLTFVSLIGLSFVTYKLKRR